MSAQPRTQYTERVAVSRLHSVAFQQAGMQSLSLRNEPVIVDAQEQGALTCNCPQTEAAFRADVAILSVCLSHAQVSTKSL